MSQEQLYFSKYDPSSYTSEYSRFIENAMISKVQEHCKTWLKSDQIKPSTELQPKPTSAEKHQVPSTTNMKLSQGIRNVKTNINNISKSQENIKLIYKPLERTAVQQNATVDKSYLKRSKDFTSKPIIEIEQTFKSKTEPPNPFIMEQQKQKANTSEKNILTQQNISHRQSMGNQFIDQLFFKENSKSPQKNVQCSTNQLKQMILKLSQKPSTQGSIVDNLQETGSIGLSKLNLTNINFCETKYQPQKPQQTYRDCEVIQIILFDQDRIFDQFSFPTQDRTTTDLLDMLFQRTSQTLQSTTRIVGFQTVDKQIPIDYYLTQKGKDLSGLSGMTLNMKPLYLQSAGESLSLNSFHFLVCIGVGGFSRVFLVRCKQSGQFLALKLISKNFVMENEKQQIIQNERDIMVQLSSQKEPHPFLCKLICAFETRSWIVFGIEYCPGGELFQQLRKVRKMSEVEAKFYFLEVCLAILHLHQNNVIYRDIKPENILIDHDGHVRVADFGLSRPDMTEEALAYSFCGSPEYMAPEMLLKEGHNNQIDHYCLGALLYELLTGLPPYYSRDTDKIYKNILTKDLTFPQGICSAEAKDLISQLLIKDRNNRMGRVYGIYEILNHPWLKRVQLQSVMSKQISPPFVPNLFTFNFDENEISKGENNFKKELVTSLKQDNELNFNRLFKDFTYVNPSIKQQVQRQSQINLYRQMDSSIVTDHILSQNNQNQDSIKHNDSQRQQNHYSTNQDLIQRFNEKNVQSSIKNDCFNEKKSNQINKSTDRLECFYLKPNSVEKVNPHLENTDSLNLTGQCTLSRVCSAKQIYPRKVKNQSAEPNDHEHYSSQSVLKYVKPTPLSQCLNQYNSNNRTQSTQRKKQTPQKNPQKNTISSAIKFKQPVTLLKENVVKEVMMKSQIQKPLERSQQNKQSQRKRIEKTHLLRQSQPNYTCIRSLATEPDTSHDSNIQTNQLQSSIPIIQQSQFNRTAYNKTLQNIFNDYTSQKKKLINSGQASQTNLSKLYQTTNYDQSMASLKYVNIRNI